MFDRFLNRRRFLQHAALFSTGLVASSAYQGKLFLSTHQLFEYIVVGFGAGSGPRCQSGKGRRRRLIEAGGDGR